MVQDCQYRRHEDDGKKTRTGIEILITVKQALDAVIMEEKMGRKWGSKVDGRAGIVSVKDDPQRKETQMPLEAGSTQPGPDTDEKTGSPDRVQLAEDFVEGLSKTGMPLRFMTLDDSERCPVRLISGMMKSKPCETGPDEAPKEYAADKELADCNDGHGMINFQNRKGWRSCLTAETERSAIAISRAPLRTCRKRSAWTLRTTAVTV